MLSTEDLFVHVYTLIDEAVRAREVVIPARPGPVPACSDVEVLTIVLVRHLLGRRSEAGFLAEVRADYGHLFPRLLHQSQLNRRTRWLWGTFEQLRVVLAGALVVDDAQQVDTSALPVHHPSRVRGPDSWTGPGGLCARFGRDGAHAEWFYGFRLAVLTDLGSRVVRAWAIVPAAVNEREVAVDLLEVAGQQPRHLLCDKGFAGRAFAAAQAGQGTDVLVPPTRAQRASMPTGVQKVIATWRNRIETTFAEITDRMELARHGAHTFWGLLTRTAATIAAHTLRRLWAQPA